MTILRLGEIHWADLDPVRGHEQGGIRPVLILSSARSNERGKLVLALPVTGSRPKVQYPYAIPLYSVAMPKESWILTRQIRTLAAERMLGLIGRVSNGEMQTVAQALLQHLLPPDSEISIGNFPGLI